MKKIAYTFLALLPVVSGFSQETAIFNGTHTACGGFLVDSGLSASDYGNNQNFTITICPEAPETIVSLSWLVFTLGTGDFLTIYDGNSTAAASFGTFSGGSNPIPKFLSGGRKYLRMFNNHLHF